MTVNKRPPLKHKIVLFGNRALIWREVPEETKGGIVVPMSASENSMKPMTRYFLVQKGTGILQDAEYLIEGEEIMVEVSKVLQLYPNEQGPLSEYFIIDANLIVGTRSRLSSELDA